MTDRHNVWDAVVAVVGLALFCAGLAGCSSVTGETKETTKTDGTSERNTRLHAHSLFDGNAAAQKMSAAISPRSGAKSGIGSLEASSSSSNLISGLEALGRGVAQGLKDAQ